MRYSSLLMSAVLASGLNCTAVLAQDKIPVIASFSILGDLVHQIGGEHVSVTTLVAEIGRAHV